MFFKKASSDGEWSVSVAEFVRHNDQILVEASSKMLSMYQEELLPLASFAEFCDVVGLLHEIENPDEFLTEVLLNLP
ncbi:hypothetical protein O3P69_008849 [Scylla paramamosain]